MTEHGRRGRKRTKRGEGGNKQTDKQRLHHANAVHGQLDRINGPRAISTVVDGHGDEFSTILAMVDATEFQRSALLVVLPVSGEEIDGEDGKVERILDEFHKGWRLIRANYGVVMSLICSEISRARFFD